MVRNNGKKSKEGVAASTSLSFVQLAKKRTTTDDAQVHSEESIREKDSKRSLP